MADSINKFKIWEPFLLSVVTIIGMIAGAKFVDSNPTPVKPDTAIGNANYSGRQVEEIIRFLETKYVGDVSSDELVEKAIKAIMEGLDPHTHYFPPDQVDELEEKTMGHYVGIGVEIMFIEDSLVVLYPKKNSPAEKAGIMPGDYILSINGQDISGDSVNQQEVIDMIKGSKGSRLKLRIKPMLENTIKTVDIIRDEIKVPSVIAAYMIDTSVAYLRISRFTNTTYREYMDQWERLATKEKARHLIIDLRDNPGGYLREAVNILSQLFPEEGKVLVYTEGKNHQRNEYKSTGKIFFPVENITVLINNNSASASEIIAGCIQDQDRGLIIGSRSYGKGLVQEQYELSNGGTLRLTVSKYYTPSGRLIQKAYDEESKVDTNEVFKTTTGRLVRAGGGIDPDIVVEDDIDWYQTSVRTWMDIISEYAIRYNLEKHNGEIISPEHVDEVRMEIPDQATIINELSVLAKKRGKEKATELIDYMKSNKQKIYRIAEATLIAYRTGEEGWYRAFNATDPVVTKAKVMVKENLTSALAQE
ncbi:MAG TPA: S41 family peptidase [Saprospiraceae bacterium]|nr:S41 family peptidase [Saprospiraceae bacterium]